MKKYRVSEQLKPYVRRILIRSFYKCSIAKDESGVLWCFTNASSDVFHRIVQRAKCEKATKETGIFQVTAREANNALLMPILLEQAKTTSFQVIDDKKGERIPH